MKDYLTSAGSALLAMPLLANHPVSYVLDTALISATILIFCTGVVQIEWSHRG